MSRKIVDRTAGLDEFSKKLTAVTESLRLLEHEVVKEKVVEATQAAVRSYITRKFIFLDLVLTLVFSSYQNEEQVKKEKTALLDKYCIAHKSLESDVNMLNALLDTTKASYEREYNNEQVRLISRCFGVQLINLSKQNVDRFQRGKEEKKVEEMSNTLQRLYQAYTQSLDWLFPFDES